MIRQALCLSMLCLSFASQALPRDKVQIAHFKKQHPCPVTGLSKGPCKGYQVDHIKPLMIGGVDHPSNMQWIRTDEHRTKTRQDFADCKAGPVCLHRRVKKVVTTTE